MSGWRREGCRITASPDAAGNLSRRFQTGGSFFDASALRAEDPSPAAGSWQIKKSMSTSRYSFDK